jgi:hypothetical protein
MIISWVITSVPWVGAAFSGRIFWLLSINIFECSSLFSFFLYSSIILLLYHFYLSFSPIALCSWLEYLPQCEVPNFRRGRHLYAKTHWYALLYVNAIPVRPQHRITARLILNGLRSHSTEFTRNIFQNQEIRVIELPAQVSHLYRGSICFCDRVRDGQSET